MNSENKIEKLTEKRALELAAKYKIGSVALDIENREMDVYQATFHINDFPPGFAANTANQKFEISACKIPFTGPRALVVNALQDMDEKLITIDSKAVEVKSYNHLARYNKEEAKKALKERTDKVLVDIKKINDKVDAFNEGLEDFALSVVNSRKLELETKQNRNDSVDPFKE